MKDRAHHARRTNPRGSPGRGVGLLAAVLVMGVVAGCQSGGIGDGRLRKSLLPLGILDTVTGRQVSAEESLADTAKSADSSPTPNYPLARLLNNDKLAPSNDRDWVEEHKVLAAAD